MPQGKLYIVATPIGNLKDITARAIETLSQVDVIACEDTRHSLKLLNHLGIKKPLLSYHKFNQQKASDRILQMLQDGQSVAIISDAGTPCISDPGVEIVNQAIAMGIEYTVIPGATAFINALVLSGFDSTKFMFAGFLPQKNKEREDFLQGLKTLKATLIFYSAPHDVVKDIAYLYNVLGNRKLAAVKEITKIYENVEFTDLKKGLSSQPKGEYVLVVEGCGEPYENPLNKLSVEEHLNFYSEQGLKQMDAVKKVAKDRNLPKGEIYKFTFHEKKQ